MAPTWVSTLPKPVFNGDAVTVWARFPRAPEGVLRLMGHPGEAGAFRCQGEVGLGAVRDDEPFMRMAAAVQGHALMQDDGDMTAEALVLAVDYQLAGSLTHFLLVEARAAGDRPADLPELLKVKSMLPAGWGGMGSVVCVDGGGFPAGFDRRDRPTRGPGAALGQMGHAERGTGRDRHHGDRVPPAGIAGHAAGVRLARRHARSAARVNGGPRPPVRVGASHPVRGHRSARVRMPFWARFSFSPCDSGLTPIYAGRVLWHHVRLGIRLQWHRDQIRLHCIGTSRTFTRVLLTN